MPASRRTNWRQAMFFSMAMVAAGMLLGCAEKRRPENWGGLVEGKITIDGEPLDGGTIAFIPLVSEEDGGRPGVARIESDGAYWIGNANLDKPKGLIPGRYKVIFLSMTADPDKTGNPIAELRIPEALVDLKTTTVECEVKPGSNTFNFDLAQESAKVASRTR